MLRQHSSGTLILVAVTGFLAGASIAGIIPSLAAANERLVRSYESLAMSEQAASFATGYVYGARMMSKLAGLDYRFSAMSDGQRARRDNAVAFGFDVAAEDDGEARP